MKKKKGEPIPEVDVSGPITAFDIDRLDEEWLGQPKLMEEYCTHHAKAKKVLADLEAKLKYVAADLNLAIRNDPARFDLPKVSEDSIKNAVILQEDFQRVQTAIIKAQYKVDLLKGIIEALHHRKTALEEEVFLFSINYFASPRGKGDTRQAMNNMEARKTFGRVGRRLNE